MMACNIISTLSLFVMAFVSQASTEEEYCQWDTFKAKCKPGEVIVMKSALYGRMQYGRCIEQDFGFVGCSTNVLYLADARCSGKHECQISIPDMEFDDHSSCPKDLIRYFTAEYECVEVTPMPNDCYQSRVKVTAPSGLLAGITTEKTGCGSTEMPWVIQAASGQTIRFTLFNYALSLTWNGTVSVPQAEQHCHVYAIVKENTPGRGKTICAGKSRQEFVYETSTNEVEVRMTMGSGTKLKRYFLLKYEVIGCPDIAISGSTSAERSGDKVTIRCKGQSHKWQLTCNGTQWLGHLGNCSKGGAVAGVRSSGGVSIPEPLSVVVIIAVAMVIGSLILVVGVICLKKRRAARQAAATQRSILQSKNPGVYPPLYTDSVSPSFLNRQDTSTENEYEYVEDLKPGFFKPPSPPLVPSGERKMLGGDCAVHGSRSDSHGYAATSGPNNNNTVPPPYGEATHEYMSTTSTSTGIPQYYELDPHILETGNGNRRAAGSSECGNGRGTSSAAASSQSAAMSNAFSVGATPRESCNTDSHWHKPGSLGHYSQ